MAFRCSSLTAGLRWKRRTRPPHPPVAAYGWQRSILVFEVFQVPLEAGRYLDSRDAGENANTLTAHFKLTHLSAAAAVPVRQLRWNRPAQRGCRPGKVTGLCSPQGAGSSTLDAMTCYAGSAPAVSPEREFGDDQFPGPGWHRQQNSCVALIASRQPFRIELVTGRQSVDASGIQSRRRRARGGYELSSLQAAAAGRHCVTDWSACGGVRHPDSHILLRSPQIDCRMEPEFDVRFALCLFQGPSCGCTIEVATLATDDGRRTARLNQDGFFVTSRFPKNHFQSTSWKPKSSPDSEIGGDLTIKGVTRRVEVRVQPPSGSGRWEATAASSALRVVPPSPGNFQITEYA